MKRVCRKNGILFVTVPASPLLWSEHDEINHHFRRYRIAELKALFKGCDLLLCSGFNSLLFAPIALHRVVRRMADLLGGERNRPLKSDFSRSQFSVLYGLLEIIFSSENLWLSWGIGLPWGVSAMIIARVKRQLDGEACNLGSSREIAEVVAAPASPHPARRVAEDRLARGAHVAATA
jgi:hypothetical protein